MSKHKKLARKSSAKRATDQVTEEIVQLIAKSISSLPTGERESAMQAFDATAEAISARRKKACKPPKPSLGRSAPARHKRS